MALTATPRPPVSPWPFVKLKLRLIVGGLRGKPARIVLFVLGAVMAGFFAIGGYALFAVPGVVDDERAAGMLLQLGGAALVLGWVFFPLLFFGVDESIDPARFALLPLPRRTLIIGLFAAALAGLPALSTLAATAGMVSTAADLGGSGAAIAQLVGIVLGLLTCVAVSRAVTSAFATGLRSRRSRDLAVVLFAVVAALLGPLQLALLAGAERADWDAFAVLADVLGWTPLAAPWSVGLDVADGRLWAVPVKFLIVAGTLVGLLWWWSATLERAMLGAASTGTAGRGGDVGSPTGSLLGRRLPRTRFGALVAREIRYWWRENRRRAALITFTVAGFFLPLSISLSGGSAGPVATFIGLIAVIALANQFGYEGNAYAANMIAGVPGRVEIHSRVAAHAVFVIPLLLLIAVVAGLLGGRPENIPGDLGLMVATYGAGLGLVLPVSVRGAFALPESTSPFAMSSGGGMAKGLLTLGVMIGTLVATVPLQILAYLLGDVWLWIGLPVGAAFGCAAYLIGSGVAGDWLDRRMPELLAAVTPGR
ncbi:ABC transporter permease [Actinoplanes sp. Pm04-4]|uniref:ABC transporter permease n=1 Tax=Paractinoplanes pyxinae TaxID=2997416 RepID=A0ABT4B474_9ACTN|nr:ABC transporter permease [Actinoplanes pyxinae]MCY1141303.1 ABC transporter permease [Actinoplanes pyxinae]